MDYSLGEEQEMLKTAARDFLTTECPTTLVKEMAEDERGYPTELWRKMANLGLNIKTKERPQEHIPVVSPI